MGLMEGLHSYFLHVQCIRFQLAKTEFHTTLTASHGKTMPMAAVNWSFICF